MRHGETTTQVRRGSCHVATLPRCRKRATSKDKNTDGLAASLLVDEHNHRVASDDKVPLAADAAALAERLQDPLKGRRARRAFGRAVERGGTAVGVDARAVGAERGNVATWQRGNPSPHLWSFHRATKHDLC